MKISKHKNDAGEEGFKMTPDDPEDLWIAYKLISPGDTVTASTFRKVKRESSGRNSTAERVKLELGIQVEVVPDNYIVGSVLRIGGKNITENDHVSLGAYHTLEIDFKRAFVLTKKVWDSLALEELEQASDPGASADLAVVLMQEGLAHIMKVGKSVTITCATIETSIPRKHGPSVKGYESALSTFFERVLQAFLQHVDFSIVKCAVIASPGFTRDQFHKHLLLEAERKQLRPIIENKSRMILVHSSSGYKHSLSEVLDDKEIMSKIKDTRAAKEVRALQEFFSMMSNEANRACYGPKHVEVAHDKNAVQTLLITDELYRNADVKERQKYVDFVESVKDSGGTVHVFSSLHVSGEQLAQITGIAAILRFPLPELDDIEM
ncbi:protein PELOTA 1-like [Argentina anserina]|uniref:protein PELOTA 1-like n=1 Tax=Argentina anserina TaxID=57926 RepID=UPI00217645C7|nr:protein PELOTA 1-like [Potentilla anserina]